jgi:hypothetical protein
MCKTITAVIAVASIAHSGDCYAQVCRSEMHWLLGWCRNRRCGRRRAGTVTQRTATRNPTDAMVATTRRVATMRGRYLPLLIRS